MASGEHDLFDKTRNFGSTQTVLDRLQGRERAYRPRPYLPGYGIKPPRFNRLTAPAGPGFKGPVYNPPTRYGLPWFQPQIYRYLKRPPMSVKFANFAMLGVYLYLDRKYKKIIEELPLQPTQPWIVDLIGTNWVHSGTCGPWAEDSILPGGNFCFVGNGVPESSLYLPLPAGVSNAYTVQINGGEVPGGIDCTASQFYESLTPFNPDPVPVFRPGPRGPVLPEPDTTYNPYDPTKKRPMQLVPYPLPPPVRGPGRVVQTGGSVGFGPPRIGGHLPRITRPHRRNPHPWRKPGPGTKERKKQPRSMRLIEKFNERLRRFVEKGVGPITELIDLLDSFYDALPWDIRKRYLRKGGLTPQEKLRILYEHWNMISPIELMKNVIKNEAEDRLIGGIGKRIKQATKKNPYWVSPRGPQAGGRWHGARVYVPS